MGDIESQINQGKDHELFLFLFLSPNLIVAASLPSGSVPNQTSPGTSMFP